MSLLITTEDNKRSLEISFRSISGKKKIDYKLTEKNYAMKYCINAIMVLNGLNKF